MTEEKTMRVELMFPSKYLRAADFKDRDVTMTVTAVKSDNLRREDGTTELKYIVHFKETEKMLVLNKTNANKIAEVLDQRDALKWIGKQITLYPTTCMAWGKSVECVRVREGE